MSNVTPESIVDNFWGIETKGSKRLLSGESTVNWHVDGHDGAYILRNAGTYGDYVSMQAALMAHLTSNGFPYDIPEPVKTINDTSVVEIEESFYMLYPYVDGEPGQFPGYDFKSLGELLGTYHDYSKDFDWSRFKQSRSKSLFDQHLALQHGTNLAQTIDTSAVLSDVFRTEYGSSDQLKKDVLFISRDLSRIGIEAYGRYVCHGDYSSDNVLSSHGKITGLIDFGGVTIDPKVTDVATSIARTAVVNGDYSSSIVDDFLAGYVKRSPLDESEVTALIPMAFVDTVRTLTWQTDEFSSNPNTRVTLASIAEYLHKAIVLRDNYKSGK